MTTPLDVHITIAGQPPRKSNSRRIVKSRRTGRPMLIKSKEALAWVASAKMQIPADIRGLQAGSAGRPLCISFWVRYTSRRPDLSVELILDTLQDAGVISDDRYVFEVHAYKAIDRANPGVDIIIEETTP